MKIAFDGHVFRWQKAGGVTRYFSEVISHLPADWEPTIYGVDPSTDNLPEHPRLNVSPLSSFRPRRFSQPIKRAYWKQSFLRTASVVQQTYYTLAGGLQYSDLKCPVAVSVHDFIGATYPDLEDYSEATILMQTKAIRAASVLICASRYTEQDLLARYPEAAGKSTVIPHGSCFPVCRTPQSDAIFEVPTFLFVGNRATYKNFLLLLRAFAKACQSHPTIRLRVAGSPLSMEERWQIHFCGIKDRVDSTIYPEEAALHQLFRQSVALLYPSRHEGFGIPPLEAMACGTLAITSNTTSLPEVVGDAGIMLDPTNEDAWTECILQVANRKIPRAILLERGRTIAEGLTWEKSAERHIQAYKKLV